MRNRLSDEIDCNHIGVFERNRITNIPEKNRKMETEILIYTKNICCTPTQNGKTGQTRPIFRDVKLTPLTT